MFTSQRRRLALAVSGLVVAAGALVLTPSGVSAAGSVSPVITGDPNAANGTISFYDASGAQIVTGPLSAPFTAYAVASSATARTGTTKATLFVATPDHTKTNSLQWFNQQLTAASNWPLVGAPAGVSAAEGAGVPAVAVGAGDGDLAGAFAGAVNDPTAGFDHIMQVRMEDSGPGKTASPPFWQADLYIDTAAGTWTQLYPAPPAAKTATSFSALNASPASPAAHGSTVTLTSTLSAADSSHPAGSVTLFDGATSKGAATFTAATGAVSATDTPSDGSHSYTFKFTPADTSTYSGATSAALAYTVSAPVATSTTLAVSPASPSTVGDPVTLTATVSPAASGTVQFFDGSTALGSPVAVAGGSAATTTSALAAGAHSLKATFTPSSGAYAGSTSAVKSYQVNAAPATTTTTTLGVTPSGPVDFGTPVALTATVAPSSAAGTVQFYDGSTALGTPVAVAAGTATKSVTTLASGSHSLSAKFLPTDSSAYGTSTSAPVSLSVNAQATSTTLAVTPAGPVDHGQSVTLKATLSPSAAVGSVQFFDGGSTLGAAVPVSSGMAQLTTSALMVGSHSLTATFTPTDATHFTGSTSPATTLVVQNPPPGATTTNLTVSPAGPVVSGSSATLTAAITPTAAVGTVQFSDGGTDVGAPVTVTSGTASTTVSPVVGTHHYTATFTPTDTTSYQPSTSSTVNQVVIPPPTATSTMLAVTPAGPVDYGTSVDLTATVSATNAGDPAPTGGTVRFSDGSTVLGSATLTAGSASLSISTLAGGSHSLTARYLPADSTVFTASTSAAVALTVNARPTTTTLSAAPAGKATVGANVTLTATIAPGSAAGSVSFSDGTAGLGSATVSGGKAVLTTSTLAIGDHSLTAAFTPADTAKFAASTSAAVSLTVLAAPKITEVTKGGSLLPAGSTLAPGDTVTVTGTGFQAGETVKVYVDNGTKVLATATANASGAVSVSVAIPSGLSAGSHLLRLRGSLASATFRFAIAAASTTPTPTPTGSSSSGGSSSGGSSSGGSSGGGGLGGSSSGSGPLANTGVQIAGSLGAAMLLLIGGAGLLLGGRRRRQH